MSTSSASERPSVPKLVTTDAPPGGAPLTDALRHALGSSSSLPTSSRVDVSHMSTSPCSSGDVSALLSAARFDLDQHFTLWASLPASAALVKDMLADVSAGREIDVAAVCARVRGYTTPVAPAAASAPGGKMQLMSPRRALAGGSPATPTSGGKRPTPPMSPNSATGGGGGVSRGPLSPISGRSPPSSPRHFTFGNAAPSSRESAAADEAFPSADQVASHGATPERSPVAARSPRGGDAFPVSAALSPPSGISPTSPVATHGIGIAMNILSPGAAQASPGLLLSTSSANRGGFSVAPTAGGGTPPGTHGGRVAAASSSMDSPRDGSSPLPPLSSPHAGQSATSGSVSPAAVGKTAMIAAAKVEAFPVSATSTSPAHTPSRTAGRSGGVSPTSPSPTGGRASSPVPLHGDGKEGDIGDFTGTSKEDDAPRSREEEKPASTRSPQPRSSPTIMGMSGEGKDDVSPVQRLLQGAGATGVSSPAPLPGASLSSAFDSAKSANNTPSAQSRVIAPFYMPGEGGRGRGRVIKADALQERLPSILELFKRHNAATIPPLPQVRIVTARGRNASSTSAGKKAKSTRAASTRAMSLGSSDDDDVALNADGEATVAVPTDVAVSVCGVALTWEDAHLGIPVEHFAAVAKTLCGFPSFFAAPLFRRVRAQFGTATNPSGTVVVPKDAFSEAAAPSDAPSSTDALRVRPSSREQARPPAIDTTTTRKRVIPVVFPPNPPAADNVDDRDTSGLISLPLFLHFWASEIAPYDHVDRFFRLVKRRTGRYIEPLDFMPFMEELLAFHPGLAFLESTPEFQEKYARTVIARIFYVLDPTARRSIDGRSLRRSALLDAFHTVDVEEDINLVNEYFSYEHFYVLYCRFWELDADHDFLLTRADLNKMTDLNKAVLDRVFAQAGRPFTSGSPDKMSFEDFIVFFMSEEDKTSEASLRFWFNVCDLRGDGVLTSDELRYFYREQEQRMRDLGMEVVKFEDVLCQLHDLLKPRVHGRIALTDFLHPERVKLTGVLFSAMFNLAKFQAFEARDPVLVKQELNVQGVTQWDRYAQAEYARLASEEEDAAAAANTVTTGGSTSYMGSGSYMNSMGDVPAVTEQRGAQYSTSSAGHGRGAGMSLTIGTGSTSLQQREVLMGAAAAASSSGSESDDDISLTLHTIGNYGLY